MPPSAQPKLSTCRALTIPGSTREAPSAGDVGGHGGGARWADRRNCQPSSHRDALSPLTTTRGPVERGGKGSNACRRHRLELWGLRLTGPFCRALGVSSQSFHCFQGTMKIHSWYSTRGGVVGAGGGERLRIFFCVCVCLNKPTVPENGTHTTRDTAREISYQGI